MLSKSASGFNRIDLGATLSIGSLLAVLLLATAAGSATRSRLAVCLNNHKQMIRAWLDYAEDNSGRLVGNLDGGSVQSLVSSNQTWVLGWLDFQEGVPNGANTNTLLLTQYSPLAPYLGRSAAPFLCPADFSLSAAKPNARHVRSISMNSYVGERPGPYTGGYRQFKQLSQFTDLAPSKAFVFIDEREDSINDPWFPINMDGYSPRNPKAYILIDFPADWHDGAANLSFADGHAETWRWRDPRTRPVHKPGSSLALGLSFPDSVDVARLQDAASRPVQ